MWVQGSVWNALPESVMITNLKDAYRNAIV